jgi:hypothetical protein
MGFAVDLKLKHVSWIASLRRHRVLCPSVSAINPYLLTEVGDFGRMQEPMYFSKD